MNFLLIEINNGILFKEEKFIYRTMRAFIQLILLISNNSIDNFEDFKIKNFFTLLYIDQSPIFIIDLNIQLFIIYNNYIKNI